MGRPRLPTTPILQAARARPLATTPACAADGVRSIARIRQPISDPEHREQMSRRSRLGLDLPADVLDVGIDGALVGLERDTVNRVQQLRSGEYATGLSGHRRKQLELSGCQLDTSPTD